MEYDELEAAITGITSNVVCSWSRGVLTDDAGGKVFTASATSGTIIEEEAILQRRCRATGLVQNAAYGSSLRYVPAGDVVCKDGSNNDVIFGKPCAWAESVAGSAFSGLSNYSQQGLYAALASPLFTGSAGTQIVQEYHPSFNAIEIFNSAVYFSSNRKAMPGTMFDSGTRKFAYRIQSSSPSGNGNYWSTGTTPTAYTQYLSVWNWAADTMTHRLNGVDQTIATNFTGSILTPNDVDTQSFDSTSYGSTSIFNIGGAYVGAIGVEAVFQPQLTAAQIEKLSQSIAW